MRLEGKLALVTGAAQGIGAATARRLGEAGANVIVADLDVARGTALANALGPSHRFVALDVAEAPGWGRLAADILATEGGLDIAFLNAGVTARPAGDPVSGSGIEVMTEEILGRVFPVNVYGVALGLIHCFPLARARGGTIIATGSTAPLIRYGADPLYSASKASVIALVKALAGEFAEAGVRLCGINPGSVDTRMYPANMREQRRADGGLASPEYLAGAVLNVLERGKPGDLWMARPQDRGYWVYEPNLLPDVALATDLPESAGFVPANSRGEVIVSA